MRNRSKIVVSIAAIVVMLIMCWVGYDAADQLAQRWAYNQTYNFNAFNRTLGPNDKREYKNSKGSATVYLDWGEIYIRIYDTNGKQIESYKINKQQGLCHVYYTTYRSKADYDIERWVFMNDVRGPGFFTRVEQSPPPTSGTWTTHFVISMPLPIWSRLETQCREFGLLK